MSGMPSSPSALSVLTVAAEGTRSVANETCTPSDASTEASRASSPLGVRTITATLG